MIISPATSTREMVEDSQQPPEKKELEARAVQRDVYNRLSILQKRVQAQFNSMEQCIDCLAQNLDSKSRHASIEALLGIQAKIGQEFTSLNYIIWDLSGIGNIRQDIDHKIQAVFDSLETAMNQCNHVMLSETARLLAQTVDEYYLAQGAVSPGRIIVATSSAI